MSELFVDTTIQVDRILKKHDQLAADAIGSLLARFDGINACAYSRLEFKRVVLQNLYLILRYLEEEKSFCAAYRRATRLIQTPRRVSTLVNILSWLQMQLDGTISVKKGEGLDRILYRRASAYIRNTIEALWHWFMRSVDHMTDRLDCKRAAEGPIRTETGEFILRVNRRKCLNQACNNANVFIENRPRLVLLCERIKALDNQGDPAVTTELRKACDELEKALNNPSRLYDYGRCLNVGDVWIHLECLARGLKDFGTTNIRESELLCEAFGLNLHVPTLPSNA